MTLEYEAQFLTAKAARLTESIAAIDVALAEIYAEIARQDAQEKEAERWKDL
jgi:hypothetical protein